MEPVNSKKPRTIVNTDNITGKQVKRLDDFSRLLLKTLVSRYEHMFNDQVPDQKIIVDEGLDPNQLDLPQFYPYKNLNFIIFRDGNGWTVRIQDAWQMLVEAKYIKV